MAAITNNQWKIFFKKFLLTICVNGLITFCYCFLKMCEVFWQCVNKASNMVREKAGIGIIVSPSVKAGRDLRPSSCWKWWGCTPGGLSDLFKVTLGPRRRTWVPWLSVLSPVRFAILPLTILIVLFCIEQNIDCRNERVSVFWSLSHFKGHPISH